VARRNPSTLICLGNTAAQTVLDSKLGITQLRVGPPKQSTDFPSAQVIPTIHPAACLYAADFFPSLVTDIGKITASSTATGWTSPTVTIIDDGIQGYKALQELHNYDEMSIDIEVGIDKETHFGHPEQYQMLCIGIGYKTGYVVVFGENCCADRTFQQYLRTLLETKKWVMQNGKFDMAGLHGYAGVVPKLWFDTMLASYVLDERPGTHGLDYLGMEILGTPNWKQEIGRYIRKGESYAMVPRDILYKYNGYDCAVTFHLKDYFIDLMTDEQRKLHDFLVEASEPLMWTEMEGVAIDLEYSDELVDKYLGVLEPLEQELKPWVENPRSPQQVKAALHDMGFRVGSTDAESLENVAKKVKPESDTNKFIQLMLTHRREQKLYGTYVKGTRKRLYRGRVHPTFLLHGTTTGRLACRNPNLQNVPRESSIRRQYVPEPGNVFVQADYATIELRVLAVESGDQFLSGIFRDGRDLHDEFSLKFYGPGFTKDQRVRTKAFVFGTAYGREPYSIALEYGIPMAEATKVQAELLELMPDYRQWREDLLHQVFHTQEDIVTRFGRHRRFWLITEANKKDVQNQALAFKPQSTASDVNLSAFTRLRRDHGLHTRIPVHDSILVECPIGDAGDVSRLMVAVMEDTAKEHLGDNIPFPVEVKFGESWGDV
jgi:DNA polymerase-1